VISADESSEEPQGLNIQIDLQPIQPVACDQQVSTTAKSSNSSRATSSGTVGSDQTDLSSAASFVSHAASLSGVRMEKVQAIQSAIANGVYNVRSSDVAQSMMSHMLGNQELARQIEQSG
jgi:negative regulator of flagellin synthesis FlgM